ncbi:MAG TPA: fused MFS/spermidine synthase [Caulobacterales bacterium]|nr:fused MFS/spermidine synthase [Caulobacterales bacterium]
MKRWVQIAILAIGFTLGIALMGVEMAAMRMMTPYFGSGIDIWACMIATVMLSLMAGYYIGGMVADRMPRSDVLGGAVLAAGIFLCFVPGLATPFLDWMLDNVGYDVNAALTSAVALMFLPMTLLSFFSPYAVRLLLIDTEHGGRVAGSVYSITTVGNIVGTLGTALGLMRFIGSREIMYSFAGLIILCAVALILLGSKARDVAR